MELRAAQIIADQSWDGLEIYEGYSGRGMMGKETTGLVGSHHALWSALAHVMEFGYNEERVAVAEALRNIRTDNMGREIIFY